jgi:hypothetical protein
MPTIDGDAHVMEGPQTWEYCDPSERKFMPVLLNPGPGTDRQFWLIDGKIRGHVRHVIKPQDFHALAEASGRAWSCLRKRSISKTSRRASATWMRWVSISR